MKEETKNIIKDILSIFNIGWIWDTSLLSWVLLSLWISSTGYTFLNNYRFINKKTSLYIKILAGLLIIFFYGSFISYIILAFTKLVKDETKHIGEKIINSILFFISLIFLFYILPTIETNAGIFENGMVRTWSFWKDNIEISYGMNKLKYLFLTLPIIIANYSSNSYIIPIINGSDNYDNSDISDKKNSEEINDNVGTKTLIFVLFFIMSIKYRILNFFSGFFKKNLYYKYMDPIDWDSMNKLKKETILTNIYHDLKWEGINAKMYGFWFMIYIIQFLIKFSMNHMLYPHYSFSLYGIVTSICGMFIFGYFIFKLIKKQKNESIDFFGLYSLGLDNKSIEEIKKAFNTTKGSVYIGLLFFKKNP